MYGLLVSGDPGSASLIHPNNVRRVIRALEMLDEGGSYATQHAGFSVRESVYDASMIGLTMNRELLYARIDQRVDLMMAQGLLEEVEKLLGEGLRVILTAAQAIGYKELVPVIEGRAGLKEAVASIKQASRRYAKRQLTWFRADPRIVWIDVTELSIEEVTQRALSAIDWS
jgi:tRNA dimethylallyltransferase